MAILSVPIGETGLRLVVKWRLGKRDRRAVLRWLRAVAMAVAREVEARRP